MNCFFNLLLISLLFVFTNIISAQTETGSFRFEGFTRDYVVFLPQNFEENMPLVLNLHGYTDNAIWQMQYSKMNDVADTAGFIVVYPNSIPPGWGSTGMLDLNYLPLFANDITYISVLLDTLYEKYNYNKSRVYCCGYSNGAHMTQILALNLRHRFAAVASMAGAMLSHIVENYIPIIPSIPIMICNGTEDQFVAYEGGGRGLYAVEETVDFWLQQNGCVLESDTIHLPDIDISDNCTVDKISYTNCTGDNQVVFYKIINGGHSWPSGYWTGSWSGNTNRDIDGSVEIWNFFKDFVNPCSDIAACKNMKLDPKYIQPSGDTLRISALLENPQNHSIKVTAKIEGMYSTFSDSIQLTTVGEEYEISNTVQYIGEPRYFSTIGPVGVVENTVNLKRFTVSTGEVLFDVDLYNYGISQAASDLRIMILTDDSRVDHSTPKIQRPIKLDDIQAGTEIKSPILSFFFVEGYNPDSTEGKPIEFDVLFYHNYKLVWTSSLSFPESRPYVDFVADKIIGDLPLTVKFSDSSSGTINSWLWDFGDGETSTEQNPLHTYETADTFNVSLTVTGPGGSNTKTKTNYIIVIDPTVKIVDNAMEKPDKYYLYQNYPNPSNPNTIIEYSIPQNSFVVLKVFNVLGSEITTLVNLEQPQGNYVVKFDGSNLTSGIYFYRLQAGNFVNTKKMILMK